MLFYISATIAIFSTLNVILSKNIIHALLNFIISLISISMIFFLIGANFAGVLEIIIYAGAIMVLFVFVVMMLLNPINKTLSFIKLKIWIIPSIMTITLLGLLLIKYGLNNRNILLVSNIPHTPHHLSVLLFTTYLITVEISAIILLTALIVASYLGRK
ncbi:NADH-quinone oxidoreductase chain J [Candidatus Portiera aleyrodidarum]|uniref:NADH-quinone oxidoreductase subunit J n=1 Tax=Candidatus Portiera aleyrodidarum TV TaxID=1297582 RepID=A0A8D4BPX6_9GAMM|nr:NADH-quinone oxidoreductase subunit J [Candidatus Portiera aleyrodidarum]AGI27255.1 NADH dehydrogenase subunit J [Candidatus Portiera aleyrodidarum TV]CEI59249.1 NADH-quinone oxidoreductase chain J [Candidatus Portiera aleyrodidarum]